MSEIKEGKKFWYVDEFRIKKYKIIHSIPCPADKKDKVTWVYDFETSDGIIKRFDPEKICFTKEEAIEKLKRNTDKLIEHIENDL